MCYHFLHYYFTIPIRAFRAASRSASDCEREEKREKDRERERERIAAERGKGERRGDIDFAATHKPAAVAFHSLPDVARRTFDVLR